VIIEWRDCRNDDGKGGERETDNNKGVV